MLFCYGESIMAEEFVKTGLMDGMGENDEIERWITVKGNHVPIKKGQSQEEAIKQAFGEAEKTPESLLDCFAAQKMRDDQIGGKEE